MSLPSSALRDRSSADTRREPFARELIRDWSKTTVVPRKRIVSLYMEAGADFLTVVGAIWSHPQGPCAGVRDFNEVFARYRYASSHPSS